LFIERQHKLVAKNWLLKDILIWQILIDLFTSCKYNIQWKLLEEEHIQKKAAYRKNKKACQWGWVLSL